ncbi:MAG TPA: flavoprotein [Actinospica sp.]|nr:flavoprotein [Actinospica sp.]
MTTSDRRVLYIVSCAAPPTLEIETLIELAKADGWDTCLILSPRAARWREADLPKLKELTGHPVRFDYKMPWEDDVLPAADAMIVCPATSNTINKWALGISDELHLGLITEAIGKGLPLVALPYLNARQAMHPAFDGSIAVLRSAGVRVLLRNGGFVPHEPGQGDRPSYPWSATLAALREIA